MKAPGADAFTVTRRDLSRELLLGVRYITQISDGGGGPDGNWSTTTRPAAAAEVAAVKLWEKVERTRKRDYQTFPFVLTLVVGGVVRK
jgi:hypothetical protein